MGRARFENRVTYVTGNEARMTNGVALPADFGTTA
jgi:hypothetical protein